MSEIPISTEATPHLRQNFVFVFLKTNSLSSRRFVNRSACAWNSGCQVLRPPLSCEWLRHDLLLLFACWGFLSTTRLQQQLYLPAFPILHPYSIQQIKHGSTVLTSKPEVKSKPYIICIASVPSHTSNSKHCTKRRECAKPHVSRKRPYTGAPVFNAKKPMECSWYLVLPCRMVTYGQP